MIGMRVGHKGNFEVGGLRRRDMPVDNRIVTADNRNYTGVGIGIATYVAIQLTGTILPD